MPIWPVAAHFLTALAITGGILAISYVAGERHRERETAGPYESGIVPTGSGRLRLSAKFYVVALLFVVFDLEAVFLFVWAVAVRELGWSGYAAASVFVLLVVAGLAYEWRQGALEWGASVEAGRRAERARAESAKLARRRVA